MQCNCLCMPCSRLTSNKMCAARHICSSLLASDELRIHLSVWVSIGSYSKIWHIGPTEYEYTFLWLRCVPMPMNRSQLASAKNGIRPFEMMSDDIQISLSASPLRQKAGLAACWPRQPGEFPLFASASDFACARLGIIMCQKWIAQLFGVTVTVCVENCPTAVHATHLWR